MNNVVCFVVMSPELEVTCHFNEKLHHTKRFKAADTACMRGELNDMSTNVQCSFSPLESTSSDCEIGILSVVVISWNRKYLGA